MIALIFQKTQEWVKVLVVNSILVDSQHSIILSKRLSGIPQTVIYVSQIFLRVPNILLNQQRVLFKQNILLLIILNAWLGLLVAVELRIHSLL
jgi:hypothetical protein